MNDLPEAFEQQQLFRCAQSGAKQDGVDVPRLEKLSSHRFGTAPGEVCAVDGQTSSRARNAASTSATPRTCTACMPSALAARTFASRSSKK